MGEFTGHLKHLPAHEEQSSCTAMVASYSMPLVREIQCTAESRLLHRIHAVLLVERGMSCRAAGKALGTSPRTVSSWVERYKRAGLEGLKDRTPSGRKPRLTEEQLGAIRREICGADAPRFRSAREFSEWLERRFHVRLQVRQCQRLLKLVCSGNTF